MKFVKKIVLGSMLLVAANSALASVADLHVTGTILPPSCTPTFAGGGVYDYGARAMGLLNSPDGFDMPGVNHNFSINCSAPLAVGYRLIDGRADTVSYPTVSAFGLGRQGSVNIGGMLIRTGVQAQPTGDGRTVTPIASLDGGTTWAIAPFGHILGSNRDLISFSAGGLTPTAYSQYTGQIHLAPRIRPGAELDADEEVNMDGLITMELVYL